MTKLEEVNPELFEMAKEGLQIRNYQHHRDIIEKPLLTRH